MVARLSENFQTQAGSINQDGTRNITRSWYAIDYANLEAADAAVVAEAGAAYTIGGVSVAYNGARSWNMVEGQGENVWLFTAEYSTTVNPPNDTNQGTATTVNGSTVASTKSLYRINYNIKDIDSPTAEDIEGDPIDSGGTPTSVVWTDRRFETTVHYDIFPDIGLYSDLVGKRNIGKYEGAPEGSVLYLGFSFSYNAANQTWEVRHQFSVDTEFFHTIQIAKTDSNGKVLTDALPIFGGGEIVYVARHVYAVQPFGTVSFAILPVFPDSTPPSP